MARNDDFSDNEIDAFDASKQQIMLDEAGEYLNGSGGSDDDDSEEEVMGLKYQNPEDSEEEDDDEDEEEGEEEEEEEDEGTQGWGSKKNFYGGDDIDDDDDNGKEMAEEALRQQKKHLQELDMGDFVDEDMMEDWKKAAEEYDDLKSTVPIVSEEAVDLDNLAEADQLKYLNGSFPEFVPLLKEFASLTPKLESFQSAPNPIVSTKLAALSSYLSTISSYFALFAENSRSNTHFSMKENPVMESILSAREVWRQANELNSAAVPFADSEAEAEEDIEVFDAEDSEEVEEQMQTDSEEEEEEEEEEEDTSDKEVDIDVNVKRTIKSAEQVVSGDFTETAAPDQVDKEEKDRRKKSLRFYTSKIDQAVKKAERNEKFTGDLDLPYKERLFERQQRLLEEARKRGLGTDKAQLGDDLDGADLGSEEEKVAHQINEDAEEYYESIKNAKLDKKQARRSAHETAKKAAREGKLAELQEHVDGDGKRALNFQILKNKGLTPNRRNENRNARVKKRKKYEQAKKKLKSVRQVYDDSNRGPYQGEKTGIKKGVSRSVKLH